MSYSNHILIECIINSNKSTLIIDTGASESCINIFDKDKFRMILDKEHHTGYSVNSEISQIFCSTENSLSIGNLKLGKIKFNIMDLNNIVNLVKGEDFEQVNGILGNDILMRLNANIDFERKKLFIKL